MQKSLFVFFIDMRQESLNNSWILKYKNSSKLFYRLTKRTPKSVRFWHWQSIQIKNSTKKKSFIDQNAFEMCFQPKCSFPFLKSTNCSLFSIAARTFGHHLFKRLSFAIIPTAFVVGVIITLLAALTIVSIKGLGVGVRKLSVILKVETTRTNEYSERFSVLSIVNCSLVEAHWLSLLKKSSFSIIFCTLNRLYFWLLQSVKYWRVHFKQHHCRFHNIIHQFQLYISDQPNQFGLKRNGKIYFSKKKVDGAYSLTQNVVN